MEQWTQSEVIFDGKLVRLRTGNVVLADGTPAYREVVEHPGGVAVVPYTGTGVVLVRQFRIAVGEAVLELPAGKLEPGDTHPEQRGAVELEEETGYRAGRLIPVGHYFGCIGFCTEKVYLYLGLDLTFVGQRLEPGERIEVVTLPLAEVRAGLRAGRFIDAKTAIGLQALLYHLDRQDGD